MNLTKHFCTERQLKKYYRGQNGDGVTHVMDTTKATAKANEKFRYFYHPDHLGSSSYITDASGEVYQHFEPTEGSSQTPLKIKQKREQYFPFGETFYEDRHDHHRTPYMFNGKELDKETGLYYYGARYYDPQISMFYGIDPLAEKYYFQSPYAYSINNPVKYIDINGMGPGDWLRSAVNATKGFFRNAKTLSGNIANRLFTSSGRSSSENRRNATYNQPSYGDRANFARRGSPGGATHIPPSMPIPEKKDVGGSFIDTWPYIVITGVNEGGEGLKTNRIGTLTVDNERVWVSGPWEGEKLDMDGDGNVIDPSGNIVYEKPANYNMGDKIIEDADENSRIQSKTVPGSRV